MHARRWVSRLWAPQLPKPLHDHLPPRPLPLPPRLRPHRRPVRSPRRGPCAFPQACPAVATSFPPSTPSGSRTSRPTSLCGASASSSYSRVPLPSAVRYGATATQSRTCAPGRPWSRCSRRAGSRSPLRGRSSSTTTALTPTSSPTRLGDPRCSTRTRGERSAWTRRRRRPRRAAQPRCALPFVSATIAWLTFIHADDAEASAFARPASSADQETPQRQPAPGQLLPPSPFQPTRRAQRPPLLVLAARTSPFAVPLTLTRAERPTSAVRHAHQRAPFQPRARQLPRLSPRPPPLDDPSRAAPSLCGPLNARGPRRAATPLAARL